MTLIVKDLTEERRIALAIKELTEENGYRIDIPVSIQLGIQQMEILEKLNYADLHIQILQYIKTNYNFTNIAEERKLYLEYRAAAHQGTLIKDFIKQDTYLEDLLYMYYII